VLQHEAGAAQRVLPRLEATGSGRPEGRLVVFDEDERLDDGAHLRARQRRSQHARVGQHVRRGDPAALDDGGRVEPALLAVRPDDAGADDRLLLVPRRPAHTLHHHVLVLSEDSVDGVDALGAATLLVVANVELGQERLDLGEAGDRAARGLRELCGRQGERVDLPQRRERGIGAGAWRPASVTSRYRRARTGRGRLHRFRRRWGNAGEDRESRQDAAENTHVVKLTPRRVQTRHVFRVTPAPSGDGRAQGCAGPPPASCALSCRTAMRNMGGCSEMGAVAR
jgi:hypothetical protein